MEHIRNEEITKRMQVQKSIIGALETRRLEWFGNVKRLDCGGWPRKVCEWYSVDRRKRGRPREEWEIRFQRHAKKTSKEDQEN